MKRLVAYSLSICICLVTSAFAQQKAAQPSAAAPAPSPTAEENIVSDQVYYEIPVETFESNVYTAKNIKVETVRDEKVELQMRGDYPAPLKDSKKYLGVKVHGKSGNVVVITPPKELAISEYCQSISVWVYGKNFSGELYMTLRDSEGQARRFSFGKLNFLGWRKLTAPITKDFQQEDKRLSQPKSIIIINIQYNPGRTTTLRKDDWEYFYLDDISARVRKKYVDKQNDAW